MLSMDPTRDPMISLNQFSNTNLNKNSKDNTTQNLDYIRVNFAITAVEIFLQILVRVFKDKGEFFLAV